MRRTRRSCPRESRRPSSHSSVAPLKESSRQGRPCLQAGDVLPVDEDVLEADARLLRLGVSGTVGDGGGVEDNHVCKGAFTEDAAIGEAKAASRFAAGF